MRTELSIADGLSVTVSCACCEDIYGLEIREDGHVDLPHGGLHEKTPMMAALIVSAKPDRFVPFLVDGKKNVTRLHSLTEKLSPGSLFRRVQVKWSDRAQCRHTEYPDNHVRILEKKGEGEFVVHEISLISQNGVFFLLHQTNYVGRAFRAPDGTVTAPGSRRWPQFVEFLKEVYAEEAGTLPPVEFYEEPGVADDAKLTLSSNFAEVLWWNSAQGFGALRTAEGPARIHWSQVAPRPRLAYLTKGELVRYAALRSPNETKMRGTAFEREAVGVRALTE